MSKTLEPRFPTIQVAIAHKDILKFVFSYKNQKVRYPKKELISISISIYLNDNLMPFLYSFKYLTKHPPNVESNTRYKVDEVNKSL